MTTLQWRPGPADTREVQSSGEAMSPSTPAPTHVPSAAQEATAAGASPRAASRLGPLLVILGLAVAGAAYVHLPRIGVELPSPGTTAGPAGLPLVTLVAVPVGLAVLVLLALVRRRRNGATGRRTPGTRAGRVAGAEPTSGTEAGDDLVPTMDPRALLLYARSLEGTLSDQEDRLEQVRRAADDRRRADVEQEHARIRATVDVMRRVHARQPGVVALGRTEAAVARLGVEPGFTRPLLPSGPAGTVRVVLAAPPAPEPGPPGTDPASVPGPAAEAPRGSLADREAALAAPPVPVELTAAGRPKVRPVPPTPDTAPTRRGRLRRRSP